MKRCQNKLDNLRQSLSGQPGWRLALSILMASVWLGAGLLPAAAQQGEPVNLLSIAPAPADSGQIAVNSPLDIDQAIDKALAVDDAGQPKTNLTIIAEPVDQAVDRSTESPATEPVEADLPTEASPARQSQIMVWEQMMLTAVPELAAEIFQMLGLLRLVLAIRAIASSIA